MKTSRKKIKDVVENYSKRKLLKKQLFKESQLVKKDNLKILSEFEGLMDKLKI